VADGPCDKESEDCEGPVSYQLDPYEYELNESLIMVRVCEHHYQELLDAL